MFDCNSKWHSYIINSGAPSHCLDNICIILIYTSTSCKHNSVNAYVCKSIFILLSDRNFDLHFIWRCCISRIPIMSIHVCILYARLNKLHVFWCRSPDASILSVYTNVYTFSICDTCTSLGRSFTLGCMWVPEQITEYQMWKKYLLLNGKLQKCAKFTEQYNHTSILRFSRYNACITVQYHTHSLVYMLRNVTITLISLDNSECYTECKMIILDNSEWKCEIIIMCYLIWRNLQPHSYQMCRTYYYPSTRVHTNTYTPHTNTTLFRDQALELGKKNLIPVAIRLQNCQLRL